MRYNPTMKLNSNEKDKKVALEKLAHGWNSNIELPTFHSLPFEGNANTEYIFLNGVDDFIIIPEEMRKIKTSMRIANPGIVIENGTLDNGQLRLTWQSMVSARVVGRNILLKLDKNQSIKFTGFPIFRSEKHSLSFISQVINDYIKNNP